MATILIIDDEPELRCLLTLVLQRAGHATIEAGAGPEGVALYDSRRPDLVLCDVVLPGMDGLTVLNRIKSINLSVPVVVMTGDSSTERAIRAMAHGASDYLVKPLNPARLLQVVQQILQSLDSTSSLDDGANCEQIDGPALLGQTEGMYEVFKLIGRVATQRSTVLILGESGTGKELVARAIHAHSPQGAGQFVALNCAAIPEALLESELFGHEKGAFTGADRQRLGKFEIAREGTLFLDEIGDMSNAVQAKLLRVLQDQEFYRLGGAETVRTTARIIAATNRNLRSEATLGKFREDLLYRLSGVVIQLPPLRERRDDIPLLAEHFLKRNARDFRRSVRAISPAAVDLLRNYDWPGNIRELANVIQQAVLLAPGPTLSPSQFTGLVTSPTATLPSVGLPPFDPVAVRAVILDRIARNDQQILAPMMAAYERAVITAVLDFCEGNVSSAAKFLGIHRVTLKSRLANLEQPNQERSDSRQGERLLDVPV